MRGYHNNLKANQKVFPLGQHTGWLDTGGWLAAGRAMWLALVDWLTLETLVWLWCQIGT